jgi:hypothetical protein
VWFQPAGTIRHNVARALSNSFATEENMDVENSSSSSSSCTSELSDPESIKSSVSQTISSVHHHQKAAGRTQRFSSSSATRHEFPTSNSAGLEFQRTPNRANSKPWRTGSCSAAAASPSNIRSMISAGTLHRGGSGSQQLHISKSLSQNFVEMDFELEEDSSFWNDHNVQVEFFPSFIHFFLNVFLEFLIVDVVEILEETDYLRLNLEKPK